MTESFLEMKKKGEILRYWFEYLLNFTHKIKRVRKAVLWESFLQDSRKPALKTTRPTKAKEKINS